jgi:alpha-mannosidase
VQIVAAAATHRFIGTEAEPRQVVIVRVAGDEDEHHAPWMVSVRAEGVATERPVGVGPLGAGEEARLEVGIRMTRPTAPGTRLPAEVVVDNGRSRLAHPFELVVAEPGWRMFMVSHFHYDPVWWNTQAAYTEAWVTGMPYRLPFQEPGLALVKAHLELARRDPDYKFVLAELDYLKPYWGVYPEDRAYIRRLLAEGRLELMGGTYNEPNTNLTSAESTIRNAIYGVAYQRDVLGGPPATAWQLDAFGHDPQFPAIMADAGLTSSSWARGPFHEWGPHWIRGAARILPIAVDPAEAHMQFATEFDWVAPSGRGLLTSFMADHYSAGWWMDSAPTLEEAEAQVESLFVELQAVATTKNVLLPVGTDYTPPNRWLTAIHRDWNRRYVWPKFLAAIPREFFEAVRRERATTGRGFSPQTRDMNPVYTGKDVSFIDTKQAQRLAENTLLSAEKFATVAALLGGPYPAEAIDKAWRQLLFGAHHDGITGSESDQVYLDLLGGWREAWELGAVSLEGALRYIGRRINTGGDGLPIAVFNALSWPRSDVVRADVDLQDGGWSGLELRDESGDAVPFVAEGISRGDDGMLTRARITFVADRVPAIGYRTYRLLAAGGMPADASWQERATQSIENDRYSVVVDPGRGGVITHLVDRRTGKELLQPGGLGNELRVYREYSSHPHFGEGPWHLIPDGTYRSSTADDARVIVEESPIGRRIRITGPFAECRREQEIVLWHGLERLEFTTRIHDFVGQDQLFRARFETAIEGGMPISEVGNAVIGRPFGFPNVDVAAAPFTLDNPAYNWFGLGATARVSLVGEPQGERSARAISVAEVIVPGHAPQDDAVRRLMVSLVRQGVTATLSRHSAVRYGVLEFDSNLPDVRISIGRPDENDFTAGVLTAADERYTAELRRQLDASGTARMWIPARRTLRETWRPQADVRGYRDLPVLVIAGADEVSTLDAITSLADDLADSAVAVEQPSELDGETGQVEDYAVALLNRGTPGFNVEPDGTMYLSLMRACSGWPSGVWIDPPRRTVPDGSNFQFQHWSHSFEYALVSSAGDWRRAEFVRAGHEYNTPLIARPVDAHTGDLPSALSFVEVAPASVVLTAMKPAGNAIAHMAEPPSARPDGVVLRLYEATGRSRAAEIRLFAPVEAAVLTNVLEEEEVGAVSISAPDELRVELDPFAITTLRAQIGPIPTTDGDGMTPANRLWLAPRREVAQPVFADYWLHNKGPAPMGYQPVMAQIRPSRLRGAGPFTLPVSVASERTDAAVTGTLTFVGPSGWSVTPPERLYRLAPGAHLALEATLTPAPDTDEGTYFAAARITDALGQIHEDVATIDYRPGADRGEEPNDPAERSALIARAIERATHAAASWEQDLPAPRDPPAGELTAELSTGSVTVLAGRRDALTVRLTNRVASEIRGEAQLISPHETWPFAGPWTRGFTVPPGETVPVRFTFAPTPETRTGRYWALVKIMYFGRIWYTEAIWLDVLSAAGERETVTVGIERVVD